MCQSSRQLGLQKCSPSCWSSQSLFLVQGQGPGPKKFITFVSMLPSPVLVNDSRFYSFSPGMAPDNSSDVQYPLNSHSFALPCPNVGMFRPHPGGQHAHATPGQRPREPLQAFRLMPHLAWSSQALLRPVSRGLKVEKEAGQGQVPEAARTVIAALLRHSTCPRGRGMRSRLLIPSRVSNKSFCTLQQMSPIRS